MHDPVDIRHVSFDVWNTLITANPVFAEKRTRFLAGNLDLDPLLVKDIYTKTKKFIDNRAATLGEGYSTDYVYKLLLANLGIQSGPMSIKVIRSGIEALFKKYPPFIHDNAIGVIAWLRTKGKTVSIASNSNFISGSVMLPFLEETLGKFDFAVFSDLIESSKPNIAFFSEVAREAWKLDTTCIETLHVGDDLVCDGRGAANIGMNYAVINSPDDLQVAVRSRFLVK